MDEEVVIRDSVEPQNSSCFVLEDASTVGIVGDSRVIALLGFRDIRGNLAGNMFIDEATAMKMVNLLLLSVVKASQTAAGNS